MTWPFLETCSAKQPPEAPVTLVSEASPTCHFLRPEAVANQTKLSASELPNSVQLVVPGIFVNVAPKSVEYHTPLPPQPSSLEPVATYNVLSGVMVMLEINGFPPASTYGSTRSQKFPLLLDTNKPPETPPAHKRLLLVRSMQIARVRPPMLSGPNDSKTIELDVPFLRISDSICARVSLETGSPVLTSM